MSKPDHDMAQDGRSAVTEVLVKTSQLNDSDSRADNRGFAETVLVSGYGLVGILNDVLEFAKIEAGRLDLKSVDFDLRTLVEDVTDLLSVSTHDRGVELACRFPVDMPVTLRGDVDRLRRVVTDLVGQAVSSTSSGEVMLELSMADSGDGALRVRFDVVGTRIDGTVADQPALFESFSGVDAASIRSRGAATLGLALARELVEAMGGQIGVQRQLGHGTTFWFTVTLQRGWSVPSFAPNARQPEQRVLIVDDRPAGSAVMRVAKEGRLSGRILLAEDNPVNQRVATAMLESLGFRVDVAADGAEAVRAAVANSYQAILMDGQMPVLDGYQATMEIRRLQAGSRHTPIIAVTGSTMKSDQQRCLAAGMDDYLAKPLNLDALNDVLTRWASRASDPNDAGDPSEPAPQVHVGLAHLDDPDRPVLDVEVVDRLERLGEAAGEDLMGQLATLFLTDADARVVALHEAMARDDAAAVVRSAHTLSGASANLGATALARLCATLAADSAVGDLIGGETLLVALEDELGRVRSALRSAAPASC